MAIIQAFTGAISGTFADQWKEIITAGHFNEHTAVAPGIFQQSNAGRGTNYGGSVGIISNGSKIFVPENTAAFIFSQGRIEAIITQPGGYEYLQGQQSVFSGDGIKESFVDQVFARVGFGGQPSAQKQIAFVNLRELRGLKFGTRSPLLYNDHFYGADLEITAFGTFSLRIVDVETFIRHYVPANTSSLSFSSVETRPQLTSEFLQAFTVALNSLSSTFRISQLPSQARTIASQISAGGGTLNSWVERFGVEVVEVGIEAIEFTTESRELVKQFSTNLMNVKAYDGVSQHSSDIAAQQKIAQGIQDHGLGDGGGMIFGMNMAQGLDAQTGGQRSQPHQIPQPHQAAGLSFEDQIEALKKMKELVDAGVLTEEEFAAKKKQIMGL